MGWNFSELSTVTNESIQLSSYFSAAVNRFTFKDFIDGDNIILEINSRPMHNGTWDWTQVAQAVLAFTSLVK
jgi:hypothetical protein